MEIEVPVRPNWQADVEQTLATTRATLGQEAFTVAWAQSYKRPLPDVIATAAKSGFLSQDEAIKDPSAVLAEAAVCETPGAGSHGAPHGLTGRELEVLRLLTAGHSNRELGEMLFISPTTAARHIANIYNKLGVDSRAEATAYAHQHGLIQWYGTQGAAWTSGS
jgi:DNA-binding NarL/FixJ family response regulator